MPKIILKFYTLFRKAAGRPQLALELRSGSKVRDALQSASQELGSEFRALVWDVRSSELLPFLLTIDGKVIPSTAGALEKTIADGEEIVLMDPVGGGAHDQRARRSHESPGH
jgi:molybdopterin converting factor small subunit